MREVGELKWAADEIAWADMEDKPVVIKPSDVGVEIENAEAIDAVSGESMKRETGMFGVTDDKDQGPKSLFDLSNYPAPWPLVPFTTKRVPKLQKKLSLHLLPQKLVVHDPWNLLFVNANVRGLASESESDDDRRHKKERPDANVKWTDKKDVVRIYNLQLSDANQMYVKSTESVRGVMADMLGKMHDQVPVEDDSDSPGCGVIPDVTACIPTSPAPHTVPEAHLYISPAHRTGVGHHSAVYEAEWELPRSLLVKDKLCQTCLREKVAEEMQGRHQRGEFPYDTTPSTTAAPSMNDDHQYQPGVIPKLDPSVAKVTWTEKSVPGMTVVLQPPPPINIERKTHAATGLQAVYDVREDETRDKGKEKELLPPQVHLAKPCETICTRKYEGPRVEVYPDVKWQNAANGPFCSHFQVSGCPATVPLTAKVRVAAKLSIEHDKHLVNEAKTYQSFPQHIFEHWSGYNVMPPLHDPVPLGAVAPQFYGYYIPEEQAEGASSEPQYLSPILLLEDCGVPIDADTLDKDEKQECASLYYRLHQAGFTHYSVAERNIVVQPGPLSELPALRRMDGARSFRLIDFGRTEPNQRGTREGEEMDVDRLFDVQFYYPGRER